MPVPRHARPSSRRPFAAACAVALGAAAVAVPLAAQASPGVPKTPVEPAADDSHVLHVDLARMPARARPALPADVTVRPGDTLWAIAGRACGDPAADLALAYNNAIADPDRIFAGQVLKAACQAAAQAVADKYGLLGNSPARPLASHSAPPRPAAAASPPPLQQPEVTAVSGYFGCAALEALWDGAGGNPADAFIAAEIAMAESGGDPNAFSPTDDRGLWQINSSNGALSTFSPSGSAHSAVVLSDDGANWSAWTTFTSGAYRGRC